MNRLYGKIVFNGEVKLKTGLHIGTSSDFAPIGAIDSPVIRDAMSNRPMIPGSSLKGKLRYLTARIMAKEPKLADISEEADEIKRIFGTAINKNSKHTSRIQMFDLVITDESANQMDEMELDMPYSEVKFENTINRITGIANPRQLERVPAGTKFGFEMVYNIENIDELVQDLKIIKRSLSLLESDYLGGHGSRGYGRICFENLEFNMIDYSGMKEKYEEILEALGIEGKYDSQTL